MNTYDLQSQQQLMNNFTNLTNLSHINSNIKKQQQQQIPLPPQQQYIPPQQYQQHEGNKSSIQKTSTIIGGINNCNNTIQNPNMMISNVNGNIQNNKPMTPIITTPMQISSANGTPIHNYQPNSQLQPPSPLIKKNLNGSNSIGNSPKNKGMSTTTSATTTTSHSNISSMNNINITSATASSPYLEVIEQESISIENVIINNRNSNVHIVVKNTSFVLKIKSLDMSKVNFSNSCVKAGLYYVGDPLKEVSYIQNPPITYVGSSCKNGEQFAIDIKISILSSQHQGHLFYILVSVTPEPNNKNNQTQQTVLSFPIRVVSKVDHIKKDPNGICEKKQTFIDILTDRLTTLERIHQDQSNLLSKMLKERGIQQQPLEYQHAVSYEYNEPDLLTCGFSTSPPSSPFSISDNTTSTTSKKHKKQQQLESQDNLVDQQQQQQQQNNNKNTAERFLDCFNKVIKVYKEDNYNKKTLELSNFISSLEYDEKIILVDLLESFTFDESSQVKPTSSDHTEDCNCEQCPYKQQAEQYMLLSPVVCFSSPNMKPSVPSPSNQVQ